MPAEPKYKKMYKDSPTIASDENGKKYIKKGPTEAEKKTARTSDGTEGSAINEHEPVYERHMKELSDMSDRHMSERKDMTKRHMKEMKSMAPSEDDEAGKEEIDRIKGEK